jgi:hypothetical protein
MSEQPVVVQKISWQDLCPWTVILKTLPIASSVTVIAFALLGVLLTPMGWLLSETLFIHQGQRSNAALMEMVEVNNSPWRSVFSPAAENASSIHVLGADFSGPRLVFEQIVTPFQMLFRGSWGGWEFSYFLFGSLWSLFVWAFVGLAITRVCLLRLARNEHVAMDDAFEFAWDKWLTAAGAVGIPLLAIAALCVPTFLIGLIMGFDFGVLLVSLLWIVVLAIAGAMALLLLGLLFGWPLMVSSVAAESQNSFDAMTRSYAYVFQRPVQYLFYMLVAILFGGFCWMIVAGLTNGVLDLAWWSTSWGTNVVGQDRLAEIQGLMTAEPVGNGLNEAGEVAATSWSLDSGRGIIGLWTSLARTVAAAFIYGLFWCMAGAIYLLLRHDVDETEMDEVFVIEEKRTYDLPPLKSDKRGIPQVQKLAPMDEGDGEE